MTEAIEDIRANGDALEQLFFNDDQFAADFSIYIDVWRKCIKPNRVAGSTVAVYGDWSDFAENHYSAIVRCWGVRDAKDKAEAACLQLVKTADATRLIELHQSLVLYFMLAGAAIDNLERCFTGAPLGHKEAPDRGDVGKKGSLKWFYERRHKAIHRTIVPIGVINELAALDEGLWDTKTTWKSTASGGETPVSTLIEETWPEFVKGMRALWSKLSTAVTSHGRPRPIAVPTLRQDDSSRTTSSQTGILPGSVSGMV